MHNEIIPYHKSLGLTPLQAIEQLKLERLDLQDVPITYAGRLDPMAEGLLLLLAGEAVHDKQDFLDSPKIYKAKILFGFCSDTQDILGIASHLTPKDFSQEQINAALQNLKGTHQFPYPIYSSKTIQGKPLWEWARENKLHNIEIPTRTMTVYKANLLELTVVPWTEIYKSIISSIQLVQGNFRQKEILQIWQEINDSIAPDQTFQIAEISFEVSSGTYIRVLAEELGKSLNSSALLFFLQRISIGNYSVDKIK